MEKDLRGGSCAYMKSDTQTMRSVLTLRAFESETLKLTPMDLVQHYLIVLLAVNVAINV